MKLDEFLSAYPKLAIAFSGGADSAYLLYAAKKYCESVKAYYVKSEFQPEFELNDAKRLARELDVDMEIIELRVLSVRHVKENSKDRCYYCKSAIFSLITEAAAKDGFSFLADGTNASDDAGDRPGMRALTELSVLSPLRECGLTKERVRLLSREAGLFTWDKPAYACLATRVPEGEVITAEKLRATELAEDFLFSLGFCDFRVRSRDGHAVLQLCEGQLPKLLEHRREIVERLGRYYKSVELDLEVRG